MPENPTAQAPRPRREPFQFEPMDGDPTPLRLLETLLKHPGRIIHQLHQERPVILVFWFLLYALGGMALYGLAVGSLSGGSQFWIAPAKLALGTAFSVAICLPSLYIFSCLGGSDIRFGAVAGALAAMVCLTSLLLLGFAPVAWIFSQSTDSIAFLGALHLLFWLIGLAFGLRVLGSMSRFRGESRRGYLRIWSFVFVIVCLQMTTTLRPIVGQADHFLPGEKKFFLSHWVETLGAKK